MISVDNLKVEFSARPLIEDASFVINDRDRIALVGKNGAGKSTMLKIISGLQNPTAGVVSIPSETTIGYLPQVMRLADETTVREEAQKAFAEVARMAEKVERLEKEMSQRTDYESEDYMALVEKYSLAHERYQMMGAQNKEAELERTLMGLGFKRTDFDRPTSEFSGGWRMRIELAKILLRRPDVLLLDEPTNHLDIESIQWLEQFLVQSARAVVLVSHDRAFINNVTNRTLEISCRKVIDYKVKYDEYVVLRKERREQQIRAYENQQKEIADTRAFIERFRYQATKAVQVQQRIRQLEKMVPVEIDEIDRSSLRLKFPPCLRSGDYPIIFDSVEKTYGDHNVFRDVTLTIKRGEKVAFVGKNGEGKSTLVKCIMGEIPFDGTLKIGHNIQIGYFAQNQAQLLDEDLTVFQTIDYVAKGEIRLRINDILGAFMFGGEESEKKVKVLSGGERSRLAMIKLLLEPVNLLILDEPTNHLDMQSKDVLKEAIKAFDGTAIIVSHDREFLDGLVSKVYEFGGGKVREHLGGIYEWIEKSLSPQAPSPTERGSKNASSAATKSSVVGKSSDNNRKDISNTLPLSGGAGGGLPGEGRGGVSYAERREYQKKISRLQKSVKDIEAQIEKMEARIAELDEILLDPAHGSDMKLVTEYSDLSEQLSRAMEQWEEQGAQIEELQAQI